MNIFFDYQSIFRQKVGGVTRYHYELYQALKEMNDVRVKCQVFGSPNYYFKDILGYNPVEKYYGLRGIPYRLNRLTNYLKAVGGKFDIIHPTWYDPYCYKKNNKGKYVITIHDMIHELFPGFPQDEIEGKRFWIHNADKIIAISEHTKKDILKIYPDVPEDKIKVIYHGKNSLPEPERVKDCPARYILYVGNRSSAHKNFKVVLEALGILKKQGCEYTLICAGGGNLTDSERKRIQELDIRVSQMYVTDPQLAYLYSNAVCFVCPSLYEGFGFPILEAYGCNCPVIVSNATCLPEVAGDAALYFEPENPEELSERIKGLWENEDMRILLKEKGKVQADKFSWEKTAQETKSLYDEMLQS